MTETNKEQHNARRVTEEGEKTTWVGREEGGLQNGLGLLIRGGRGKKGEGLRKSRSPAMTDGDLRDRPAPEARSRVHICILCRNDMLARRREFILMRFAAADN